MTPIDEREARWIRVLRVNLRLEWAQVSDLYTAATGCTINGGGKVGGADLCRYAADLLGENFDDWNC